MQKRKIKELRARMEARKEKIEHLKKQGKINTIRLNELYGVQKEDALKLLKSEIKERKNV